MTDLRTTAKQALEALIWTTGAKTLVRAGWLEKVRSSCFSRPLPPCANDFSKENDMKHYEFVTGDTIEIETGKVIHRIRATTHIEAHGVKPGDLGGRIATGISIYLFGAINVLGIWRAL